VPFNVTPLVQHPHDDDAIGLALVENRMLPVLVAKVSRTDVIDLTPNPWPLRKQGKALVERRKIGVSLVLAKIDVRES